MALLIGAAFVAGCQWREALPVLAGEGGSGRSTSLAPDGGSLDVAFETAIYRHDPDGDTVIILSDRPVEELLDQGLARGQLFRLDILWTPRAGSTPMDPSATNTGVRHLIAVEASAGLYAGAGYVRPIGDFGEGAVTLVIRDSALRLVGRSEGFRDLLSPARFTGRVTAVEDAEAVTRLSRWLERSGPPPLPSTEVDPPAPMAGPMP